MQQTIIDAYYKPFKGWVNISPTRFIRSKTPLRFAFYLILLMVLIHMILSSQRRQRIIPVMTAPTNKSLEFIRTVGGLYYSSKNHKNIAMKLCIHYKEYVNEKYFISDFTFSSQNIRKIVEKTGVESLIISNIIGAIDFLEKAESIDETWLQDLNKNVEIFYKKCK